MTQWAAAGQNHDLCEPKNDKLRNNQRQITNTSKFNPLCNLRI